MRKVKWFLGFLLILTISLCLWSPPLSARNTQEWSPCRYLQKGKVGCIIALLIKCMRGTPKNPRNLFRKHLFLYLFLHVETVVTFTVFPIWCSTPIETFFPLILMPFSASGFFLFPLYHIGKTFPFGTFFFIGGNRKSHVEGDQQLNRAGGAWGSCCFFGQKLLALSVVWAGALVNYIVKWANELKESSKQKKNPWNWMQSPTTTPAGTQIQMGS